MKNNYRLHELREYFFLTEADMTSIAITFGIGSKAPRVALLDHDGAIRDTNPVKDERLGEFIRIFHGKTSSDGTVIKDSFVNAIHRNAHGDPMSMIFVEIFKQVYGKDISIDEGQKITEDMNQYIKPYYSNRKLYDNAREYHEMLYLMGVPMYILTGMEDYMVEDSLQKANMRGFFGPILGSPIKKKDHVKNILDKYKGWNLFASGDAASEYKATKGLYPDTLFIGLDMEGTGNRQIFPKDIEVVSNYKALVKALVAYGSLEQEFNKYHDQNLEIAGISVKRQR